MEVTRRHKVREFIKRSKQPVLLIDNKLLYLHQEQQGLKKQLKQIQQEIQWYEQLKEQYLEKRV